MAITKYDDKHIQVTTTEEVTTEKVHSYEDLLNQKVSLEKQLIDVNALITECVKLGIET